MVRTTIPSVRSWFPAFRLRAAFTLSALLYSALLSANLQGLLAQPADYRVDLTLPAPVRKVVKRRPESALGFPYTTSHAIPLEISTLHVSPTTWTQQDRVEVEILIKNAGSQPISLPISRDFDEQFAPGRTGRTIMYLTLALTPEPESGAGNLRCPIAETIGSSSDPGSFVKLLPGQTLWIRASAEMLTFSWAMKGARFLDFKAGARLIIGRLRDDQYVENYQTDEVLSTNEVDLKWRVRTIIHPAN